MKTCTEIRMICFRYGMIEIQKLSRFLNVFIFSRLFTEQRNPANVHGTAHKVRQHAASYLTCTGYPQLWKT